MTQVCSSDDLSRIENEHTFAKSSAWWITWLCGRRFHFPIGLEPSIDQRYYRIKGGMTHAPLLCRKLNELVRALNISRAFAPILSRPRSSQVLGRFHKKSGWRDIDASPLQAGLRTATVPTPGISKLCAVRKGRR